MVQRNRKSWLPLLVSGATVLVIAATWLVLNRFRVKYYNSAIEGPNPDSSPYFKIVRVQDWLVWAFFVSGGATLLFGLLQVARALAHLCLPKWKSRQ